ncbi:MAG: riboflavin synthase [Firmicutes bacterium]|nr:riboflavin synthase [Bacillota bacterium]
MFTGIIEEVGVIHAICGSRSHSGGGSHGGSITIKARLVTQGLAQGHSVSVDGTCLTVTQTTGEGFAADLSQETIRRTTLGRLRVGRRVNLERALRLGDRLGGHLVAGHVDGVGRVLVLSSEGHSWRVEIKAPPEVIKSLAMKGSVAVDGVSLTVAGITGETFWFSLIPHTARATTLGELRTGQEVNLEADLIARYVRSQMGIVTTLDARFLEEHGFLQPAHGSLVQDR